MHFVIDRAGPLQNARRTPNGGYVVDAVLARTGVLRYTSRDECGERACLNTPEALQASLDEISLIPVTNRHPERMVTSETYAKVARGHVVGAAVFDDGAIKATLAIQDQDLIADIERGVSREVSMGYYPDDVPEAGTFDGQEYTHKRTMIKWNHIAIVPAGRAGSAVRLVLDSEEIPGDDMKLTILGKEYSDADKAQAAIDALEVLVKQHETEAKEAKDAVSQAEAKLAEATSEERIAKLVKAARDADKEAEEALKRREAVKKAFPKSALDDKGDDVIKVLFENLPAAEDKLDRDAVVETERSATDEAPAPNPRQRMLSRLPSPRKAQ